MPPAEAERPLPLVSLLLVGMVVPAVCVAVDHLLLSQLISGAASGSIVVVTPALCVFQIGLFGVLGERWIAAPLGFHESVLFDFPRLRPGMTKVAASRLQATTPPFRLVGRFWPWVEWAL